MGTSEVVPMTDEYDYEGLLTRAHDSMPEEEITREERWAVPELDLMYEGKMTVWKNFQEIAETIRRDPVHIQGHILRSLGSAGSQEGRRLILKSVIPEEKLKDKVNEYVSSFVICGECGKPDTHLIKEGRTNVVECMACGAKRPVKVKKGLQAKERRKVMIPGDEVDVMIQDVGRLGDGIAKVDKYIIYVPGVTKGAAVRIKIEKVSGTIVIGRVIS